MSVIAVCVLAAILLLLGFEMFLVMGIPTLVIWLVFFPQLPALAIAQKLLGGVNVSTLLAIPFFIFAAEIMARGTIAKRLTDLVKANLGHYRGGMGYTTVASCMAFGAVCGSAPATVAALGGLLHPELVKTGYSEKFSLGLIAASAECALLIPPSITLIIYGWLTGTSIADLFAAGLAVGLVLGLAFMVQVKIATWRTGASASPRASWRERLHALRDGAVALGLPILILGSIYSGAATATEAAAVAVIYAIVVEVAIYRSFGFKVLMEAAESFFDHRRRYFCHAGDGIATVLFYRPWPASRLPDRTFCRVARQLGHVFVDCKCRSVHCRNVHRSQFDLARAGADPFSCRGQPRHRSCPLRTCRVPEHLHWHDHASIRTGPVRSFLDAPTPG